MVGAYIGYDTPVRVPCVTVILGIFSAAVIDVAKALPVEYVRTPSNVLIFEGN